MRSLRVRPVLQALGGLCLAAAAATATVGCGSAPDSGAVASAPRDVGRQRGDTEREPTDTGADASSELDPGGVGGPDVTAIDLSGGDPEPGGDPGDTEGAPADAPAIPDATGDLTGADTAGFDTADGGGVYDPDGGPAIDPDLCPAAAQVPTGCIEPVAEATAELCDGFDNDCDGDIDEGCVCKLGEVRSCFLGPPGRVATGACAPGTMRCATAAAGERWGACEGGRGPSSEVCDGLDNDCNGCTDEVFACDPEGSCPGPGDPRTPDAQPFVAYPLRGGDFYTGPAVSWTWTIAGGPCDDIVPGRRSFTLTGANRENATFTATLSGSYTVTLRVQTPTGVFECTWVIHVVGPGLRVEMCYPESMSQDVDLLMMRAGDAGSWYPENVDAFGPNPRACSWWNCEGSLRGAPSRASWGYGDSPLAHCVGGPLGDQWRSVGFCANPRLDIDNNLSEGTGLPENINIDNPNDGDAFRVMLQNFTGAGSHPLVNVYCGGRLMATYGRAPDDVTGFAGESGHTSVGAMWRVADVTMIVADGGSTVGCTVRPVHPPGAASGYDVTYNDPRW